MKCADFLEQIERLTIEEMPDALLKHASSCKTCEKILSADEKITRGFRMLRLCSPTPDLSPKIMQKISQLPVARKSVSDIDYYGLLKNLFFPGTPMKSTLIYGSMLIIIITLCLVVIRKAHVTHRTGIQQQFQWVVSSGSGKDLILENSKRVTFPEGSRIEMALAERARITVENGCVTPLKDGFELHGGSARISVTPAESHSPFSVRCLHATVTVIGTTFILNQTPDSLRIKVESGRVRVETFDNATLELSQGDDYTVSKQMKSHALPASTSSEITEPPVSRHRIPDE